MFVCSACSFTTSKWMGKCPECDSWNSFEEQEDIPKKKGRALSQSSPSSPNVFDALAIKDIVPKISQRVPTGFQEFDRVLGGGLMLGSSVLLGGEPGIGKSTLLLQTAAKIAQSLPKEQAHAPVLYFCTEESQEQVALRAKRLHIDQNHILLSQEYRTEHIEQLVHTHKPRCIIIDSIQALRSLELGYNSGQVNHIRHSAAICCEWAHQYNAIVIIVAHITKEGIIAGPKLIEHMVDTVLMFEKAKHNLRFLYAKKNRHGAVDEVGVVHMTETGLQDAADMGLFFLEERESHIPPGVCVAATYEGTRPFLVEIQSLTVAISSNSRVFSDRIDARQISRIAAVLERHMKLPLTTQNLYINVAGGIRISEPGLELALALSLYSAYKGVALPPKICAVGELSLPGEIHSVENFPQRCRQAVEYGFTSVIAASSNIKNTEPISGIRFVPVTTIGEAIHKILH